MDPQEKKKNKWYEVIFSNNIVPIVVAIIAVVGGKELINYRLDLMEKKIASTEDVQTLQKDFKDFVKYQERINDVLLKSVASRGYATYQSIAREEKTPTSHEQVELYYGNQANKIMQEKAEIVSKIETIEKTSAKK